MILSQAKFNIFDSTSSKTTTIWVNISTVFKLIFVVYLNRRIALTTHNSIVKRVPLELLIVNADFRSIESNFVCISHVSHTPIYV